MSKREVRYTRAVDIELLAVGKLALVAVGRADQAQQGAAGRNFRTVEFRVANDKTGDGGAGRLEAQHLLDRLWNESAVGVNLLPLLRMLGQQLAHPADQPVGGLVAGAG